MQASCNPCHVEDAHADRTNGAALKRQFNIQTNGVAVISHKEAQHDVNSGNTFCPCSLGREPGESPSELWTETEPLYCTQTCIAGRCRDKKCHFKGSAAHRSQILSNYPGGCQDRDRLAGGCSRNIARFHRHRCCQQRAASPGLARIPERHVHELRPAVSFRRQSDVLIETAVWMRTFAGRPDVQRTLALGRRFVTLSGNSRPFMPPGMLTSVNDGSKATSRSKMTDAPLPSGAGIVS
jgi:hypothetical protein